MHLTFAPPNKQTGSKSSLERLLPLKRFCTTDPALSTSGLVVAFDDGVGLVSVCDGHHGRVLLAESVEMAVVADGGDLPTAGVVVPWWAIELLENGGTMIFQRAAHGDSSKLVIVPWGESYRKGCESITIVGVKEAQSLARALPRRGYAASFEVPRSEVRRLARRTKASGLAVWSHHGGEWQGGPQLGPMGERGKDLELQGGERLDKQTSPADPRPGVAQGANPAFFENLGTWNVARLFVDVGYTVHNPFVFRHTDEAIATYPPLAHEAMVVMPKMM